MGSFPADTPVLPCFGCTFCLTVQYMHLCSNVVKQEHKNTNAYCLNNTCYISDTHKALLNLFFIHNSDYSTCPEHASHVHTTTISHAVCLVDIVTWEEEERATGRATQGTSIKNTWAVSIFWSSEACAGTDVNVEKKKSYKAFACIWDYRSLSWLGNDN